MADIDILNPGNNDSSSNNNTNTSASQRNRDRKIDNDYTSYLQHIDETLDKMFRSFEKFSQSAAKDQFNNRSEFRRSSNRRNSSDSSNDDSSRKNKSIFDRKSNKNEKKYTGSSFDRFMDSFEDQLQAGLFGSTFKDKISKVMENFADSLGVEVEDIPNTIGGELGRQLTEKIKNSGLGSSLLNRFNKYQQDSFNKVKNKYNKSVDKYWETHGGQSARMQAEEQVRQANIRRKNQQAFQDFEADYEKLYRVSQKPNEPSNEDEETREFGTTTSRFNPNAYSIQTLNVNTLIVSRIQEEELSAQTVQQTQEPQISKPEKSVRDTTPEYTKDARTKIDRDRDQGFRVEDSESKTTSLINSGDTDSISSNIGDKIGDVVSKVTGNKGPSGSRNIPDTALDVGKQVFGGGGGPLNMVDDVVGAAGNVMSAGTATGAATSGIMSSLTTFASALGPAAIAMFAFNAVLDAAAPAIKGFTELMKSAASAYNRSNESRERNAELAQQRLMADMESMIREPFEILKDAANEVYQAWDQNIRLINGTQGYTKEDLQTLLGNYSQRLRDEGLSSVVSSVDITESLAKVLESGLSGAAAEEFAYTATLLNAAIPTQDFFGYADTYASIAATAMQQGMDQASALEYANTQLEAFANNILTASRQLTGGFTTGLQNAESLFEQSVQIAQAGRTNDATEISGVMTTVAAIVGSIAPDLASSLTDVIYNASIGGNSDDLVALRSLAGINASNTEFLNAVTSDPQGTFEELFRSLAQMQNMSESNYMEVAEGLSNIFGVSSDAIARVDFNYLADAIASMDTSATSLEDNIKLLASGETTTSAEQLRMQQINEYLIDEGLAYVLDNEVARSVQEHMWDEQIARSLMEATYAVDLKGGSMKALSGLVSFGENILNVLTLGIYKGVSNFAPTYAEAQTLSLDTAAMLEAGKVGDGNQSDLSNLITVNKDLYGYTQETYTKLLNNLGGSSFKDATSNLESNDIVSVISGSLQSNKSTTSYDTPTSVYDWGSVGKSVANYLSSTSSTGSHIGNVVGGDAEATATEQAQQKARANLNRMLDADYVQKFIDAGDTYDDWVATAKNFGISNFEQAVSDAGYDETELQNYFSNLQANAAVQRTQERNAVEEQFWVDTVNNLVQLNESTLEMIELQTHSNEVLEQLYEKHTQFYDAWVDYFVNHTAYNNAYDFSSVAEVQRAEKGESQDAIYALAEALTKNSVDLLDPTIQTNALLSQILIVVNAIMQQNNETATGTTLPDTLSALALGLIKG